MATTTVQKLKVSKLTKFGFIAEGVEKGFYLSPKFDEAVKVQIVPGVELEGAVFVADSGAQYLNNAKVLSSIIVKEDKPSVKSKKDFKANKDTSMTKDEWAAKDRSQLIGGLSHDAATLTAAILNVQPAENASDAVAVFKDILAQLLKVRDELE